MRENELSGIIIDIAYKIHSKLGPGLFESVYEEIFCYELKKRQIEFYRQKVIPVFWDSIQIDIGFKADIIVEEKVIIEIKSIEKINNVHPKQLLTYLKISGCKLGLLINFNETLIKDGITRIANNL